MLTDNVTIVCTTQHLGPVSKLTQAGFRHASLDYPFMLPRAMISIEDSSTGVFVDLPRWKAEDMEIDWRADREVQHG